MSGVFDWQLKAQSSKSLKALLFHNRTQIPSLCVAHIVHLKKEYKSVKTLLQLLKHGHYGWEVIGDFKMIAFIIYLQGGFTNFIAISNAGIVETPKHTITRENVRRNSKGEMETLYWFLKNTTFAHQAGFNETFCQSIE